MLPYLWPPPANTLYLPTPFPNLLQASGILPLSCRSCRCAPLPRRLSTPIDSSKPSKTPKHLPHATEKVFAFWTLMTLGHPLRPLSQQPDFVVLCVQPARSLQRINSLESGPVLTRPSPPPVVRSPTAHVSELGVLQKHQYWVPTRETLVQWSEVGVWAEYIYLYHLKHF